MPAAVTEPRHASVVLQAGEHRTAARGGEVRYRRPSTPETSGCLRSPTWKRGVVQLMSPRRREDPTWAVGGECAPIPRLTRAAVAALRRSATSTCPHVRRPRTRPPRRPRDADGRTVGESALPTNALREQRAPSRRRAPAR